MSRPLSLDDLVRRPEPGMDAPGAPAFGPDGRSITYLFSAEGSLVRSLWRHDLASDQRRPIAEPVAAVTSEETISTEDHLVRERTRTVALGVTSYAWASDAPEPTLMVPMGGRLFVAVGDEAAQGVHEMEGIEGASAPVLSPDGSRVAYEMDGNLLVAPVRGGRPRRLTDDAEPGVRSGVAEFIAAEELDRFEGAWWSADSRSIAYARVDERPVPPIEIGVDGSAAGERHHYPFPGGPNARVRLRVTPASRARSRDVDLGMGPDDYLARVVPHPGGGWLAAVLPRDQRSLRWYRVAASGSAVPLWVEHGDPWINLDDDTRVLADGRILRSSERSGHRHLELRTPDGSPDRVLTAGDWVVTGVVGVSERRREVLFMATRDSVLERHLYAASLDAEAPAEEPHRLTVEPGWHEVVASPDGERWIDTWSDLDRSPSVRLCSRDGVVDVIYPASTSAAADGLTPPALLDLVAADGKTPLSTAVYRPRRRSGEPAPPAVVWVYGGPHAQSVKRSWEMTVQRLRQYLCQAGAAVVVVDNRGAAFRGVSFESGIAGHLGGIEVADQAAAVRQLAARGELDPTRVGIVGGSYGGFMTVMAMAREPELFKVGVAISPVAEWAGYDTAYTERYLRTPAADPEAYGRSSALTHANEVRGDLLLIHGTLDENVHLRHSLRLREALAAAGRPVELVELAGQRHRVRGSAIGVREKRTLVHLLRGLGLPIPGELG